MLFWLKEIFKRGASVLLWSNGMIWPSEKPACEKLNLRKLIPDCPWFEESATSTNEPSFEILVSVGLLKQCESWQFGKRLTVSSRIFFSIPGSLFKSILLAISAWDRKIVSDKNTKYMAR